MFGGPWKQKWNFPCTGSFEADLKKAKTQKTCSLIHTIMYLFDKEKNNLSELNKKKEHLCGVPIKKQFPT